MRRLRNPETNFGDVAQFAKGDKVEVQWVDMSNVWLDHSGFLQTLPSRWVWILIFIIVALSALLFLVMPKAPIPRI